MKMKKLNLDEKTMEQARHMLVAVTGVVVVVAMGFAVRPVVEQKIHQREAQLASAMVEESDESAYQPAEQSIATFRDERTRSRSVTVAQLNAIIEDESTDEQTRREAQQALMMSMERSEQETAIEGLTTALGFESCVASVGDDTCTVIVKAASLTRQQAAQILDVACRETGMLSGSIKVIPVE